VRGDHAAADGAREEAGVRFATSIDLRDRARAAESVGDLLLDAPGLQLRRMGDGFAAQRVSLRGAPAAHVLLVLDGVVLNSAASDEVDPSLLPPAVLERAEVYRGAVPLRFGHGGLGGAVSLTTRAIPARPTAWVGAGGGSFGARRGGVFVAGRSGAAQGLFALSYRGTQGDFGYYDPRGTDDPRDDGEATRTNNASDAVDLFGRFCAGAAPSVEAPCVQVLAGYRRRGLAGVAGYPTEGPFSEQRRVLVRAGAMVRGARARLTLYGAAGAREELLDNRGPRPLSTLREGTDRATGWHGEVGALGEAAWRSLRGEAVLRVRGEGVNARSAGAPEGERLGAMLGAELSASAGVLRVDGGVGGELVLDRGASGSVDRWLLSPRLGARVKVTPWLELRANGAWLQRAPTLVELYGDRGVIAGNPSLRNERAWSGDLGAVVSLRERAWSLRVEAAGFARDVEDVVVLRQTDRALYRPVNRDRAGVFGVEAQVRVAWREHLRLTLAYAFIDARITAGQAGTAGNALPGVAPHDLYARVEGRFGWARASMDVSFLDRTPLDDANGTVVPARALVGATVSVTPPFARSMSLAVQVTNLLDARVADRPLSNPLGALRESPAPLQDWLGFPLPGRAVFVMLSVEDPPPT